VEKIEKQVEPIYAYRGWAGESVHLKRPPGNFRDVLQTVWKCPESSMIRGKPFIWKSIH